MTCQFCQTWNTDDDHRCRRCGRRIRTSPGRISPRTYPIAASATAREIEFDAIPRDRTCFSQPKQHELDRPEPSPQSVLFDTPVNEPRVISFDSITSPLRRGAIHARAANLSRPSPNKVEKVESSARLSRRTSPQRTRRSGDNQQTFDFLAQQDVALPPVSTIICDSAVAPAAMRLTASLVDLLIMFGGTILTMLPIWFGTGSLTFDKRTLLILAVVALVVCAAYRVLCIVAGCDSIGMRAARLRLIDFDGRKPARNRRYLRLLGSLISVLAAGLGVIWSLFDEDSLTWHDHISGTFPTPEE